MITIMEEEKKDFIVCEGTKERLPAHHKKIIMHYLNMMGNKESTTICELCTFHI